MPIENYRMVFELDEEAFSGYFSNEELTDLSEDDIATVIIPWDLIWIISRYFVSCFPQF